MTLDQHPADPAELGMDAARFDDARALMQRQFDEGASPMLVAVVARHGRVVFSHAVGDARPGGPPLTVESVFPVASQSKPMTAAVLLALVERGLVGLNEPAALHLPELADHGHGAVMVHHLLSHTSGWNDDDQVEAMNAAIPELAAAWDGTDDLMGRLLLEPAWAVPRRTEPGDRMQYCNANYSMAGEIVKRVTGGTLDAAMRRYLFEPTGMTRSSVIVGPDLAPHVIERPAGIPFGPDHPDSGISFNDPMWAASDDGASGVHASAVDCARFGQMILDGGMVGGTRVLSRDTVRVMTTDQIPGVPAEVLAMERVEASWGYGFGITTTHPWLRFSGGTVPVGSIRHGGAGGIDVWIDPRLGIVGVYFEMVTQWSDDYGPESWAAHRFEDVVTASVVEP